MQPQQPSPYYQAPPPPPPSQYDFIVNPAPPPKKSLVPVSGSMWQRAAIVGGAFFGLIIIAVIFMSILSGGGGSTTQLVTVAQEQNELIRIATLGTQQATDQSAKNFAYSLELSLTSEQQQLLTYLQSHGKKLGTKELALKHSATTDTQLSAAQAASTFDATFEQIMRTQLTSYQSSLKSTYTKTTGVNARSLLNNEYSAAGLLLEQLPSSSNS